MGFVQSISPLTWWANLQLILSLHWGKTWLHMQWFWTSLRLLKQLTMIYCFKSYAFMVCVVWPWSGSETISRVYLSMYHIMTWTLPVVTSHVVSHREVFSDHYYSSSILMTYLNLYLILNQSYLLHNIILNMTCVLYLIGSVPKSCRWMPKRLTVWYFPLKISLLTSHR